MFVFSIITFANILAARAFELANPYGMDSLIHLPKQPKKPGVAAAGKRQAEELYYRYHRSKYLRSKNEDAESHVRCFMNMIGPYEAFAGHCADVIDEPSRSDGESQDPKFVD